MGNVASTPIALGASGGVTPNLMIDATLGPGDHGAPLLSSTGDVVGIIIRTWCPGFFSHTANLADRQ
jgi:hypothetical protein